MANDGIIKDILDDKVLKQLDDLNKKLLESLATISKLNQEAGNFKTFSQGNTIIQQRATLDSQVNLELKERNRILKAIATQEEKNRQASGNLSRELANQRYETQQINKLNRENAVLTSKFSTEYQKLNVQLERSRRTLKDLVLTQGENAAATKKAAAEVQKLDTRLKRADAVSGQFQRNVGNYPTTFKSAILSIRNLVSAFGLYSGIQIAKEIYEQVKALDGLNKALLQVTETQLNFNAEQNFLKDLAEESGTNILSLTGAYTKFLASAKTTNLTTEQTRNIFRQTAKAAGVLGLSTEDANGAFRALEQILSKGKVQAEEIRGQLGERLPGAFQILARSMGLTTAELSKQLELGNVLSEDVLPGFAEELERTYSLDKVERVQTLAAEQERLGNSWIQFIANVEDGDGTLSKVLGGALKLVTGLVDAMGKLVQSSNAYNTEVRTDRAESELQSLRDIAEETGQSLKEVALSNFFNYTKSAEKAREEVARLQAEQEKILKQKPGLITGFGSSVNTGLEENKRLLEQANVALAIREGRLDAINKILREQKTGVADVTEETEKLKKVTEDLTPKIQKVKIAFEGDTEDLEKEVRQLLDPFKDVFDVSIAGDILKATSENALKELEADLKLYEDTEKRKTKIAKEEAEERAEIFSVLFSTFADVYGLDLTLFEKMLAKEEVALMDYAEFAKSANGAIFQGKFNSYEEEERKNREMLDAILNDKNANDKKKEQAQKEYDKKEKEINRKKAQATKNQALFDIAIAASVAFVKSLPNYAQAFAMLAIGAVQAGIVASKKVPEYYKGKNVMDKYEGPATVNELPGQREVRINKAGGIEVFKPGLQKTFVKRDDIIMPSFSSFNRAMGDPNSNVFQRVASKINNDTRERTTMFANVNYIDPSGIEKAVERAMSKITSRSFAIHNNVNIQQPRTRY